MVRIGVDKLAVGKQLTYPVYDQGGLLLLAEGSLITPRFKDLLSSRNIAEVHLHPEDAARVVNGSRSRPARAEHVSGTVDIETDVTRKLDALVDSGALQVGNTGPAVRDRMVMFAKKPYDPRQRERLVEHHTQAIQSLNNMMETALGGNEVTGQSIAAVAAGYLNELTADSDHVLSVAADVRKDSALNNHCLQLALLGMSIGIEMGLDETNVRSLGLCGMIHDWGMIKVPAEIRNANRVLTSQEFQEIQKHPIYTLELMQNISRLPSVVALASFQVHEKLNGTGYPRGRSGNSIHLFARILHVADSYLALTSNRPFRPALMSYAAMECLLKQSQQNLIDPKVVRSLLHVLSLFPVGSFLRFTDGSVGRVLRRNGNQYMSPIVQLVQDHTGQRLSPDDPATIFNLAETNLKIEHAMPTPGRIEIALSDSVLNRPRE